MNDNCPFGTGNPVQPVHFFNRRQPLRRTVSRLLRGESTALVGEPRSGKTSLLHYLKAAETQSALYSDSAGRLVFSFVDSHALGSQFDQPHFWERALTPLRERLVDPSPASDLARQYAVCQQNAFGANTLEIFFERLHAANHQLILLLDEFDGFLHHPILNSAEFFGSLRTLASRSAGALTLVIASRQPLGRLNELTQVFNPSGSPYFNIFSELTLADFPDADVDALLHLAGERFTAQDRSYLRQIAGGQPFLLQAAAAAMWDAPPAAPVPGGQIARRRYVAQQLYTEQRQHFGDAWRNWSSEMRKAFTVVGLATTRQLLANHKVKLDPLLVDLNHLGPELKDHGASGLLAVDGSIPGGWRVRHGVMLWWLADELERAIRSESEFGEWLRRAELDGRWTKGQKQRIFEVVQGAGNFAMQLIEAFAIGVGAGASSGGD